MVPHVDTHVRHRTILVQDDLQAVREGVFLVRDLELRLRAACRRQCENEGDGESAGSGNSASSCHVRVHSIMKASGALTDSLRMYRTTWGRLSEIGLVRVGDVRGVMPSRRASMDSLSM